MKEVLIHNSKKFVEDFKSVREILVFATNSCSYFKTSKRDVWREAKTEEIKYYMDDKIFKVKRTVMVII